MNCNACPLERPRLRPRLCKSVVVLIGADWSWDQNSVCILEHDQNSLICHNVWQLEALIISASVPEIFYTFHVSAQNTEFEVEPSFLGVELSLCSWIVAAEAAWLAWHISGETLCCYLMHDQSSRLQQWPQHRAVGHIMLLIEHAPSLRGYAGCILVLLAERSRGGSDGKFQNISSAGRLF